MNKDIIAKQRKIYNNSFITSEKLQQLSLYEEIKEDQIKCKYCGKWMKPTNIQVRNRLKSIRENGDGAYIYCSDQCKEECPVYNKILYPRGFKPASSREVNPVLRQLVLERDNYICQKCFKNQKELNVGLHCHHINPNINSPIETNDPDNCITLCKNCHKIVHKIPGCTYSELRCNNK
jgi:hypothetical protein